MESNTKKMIVLTFFISLIITSFAKKIIKIEEISTETSLSTTSFTDENTTIEYTSEFFNETTTVIPFYNATLFPNKITNMQTQALANPDFCTCDLQPNICDLNCCCDEDCSSADKEVFQHCEVEPRYYDTRYCDYVKYIYINNTRFQWEINQNGLFCVIKSNNPPSYILQRKHPLKTFEESEREKDNKFLWSKYDIQNNDSFNSSSKFIYGSPVWYVDRKGLRKFDLPNSFITSQCLIKENVFYLKNLHTTCTQVNLNDENPQLSLKYYVENIKFVAVPKLLHTVKYKGKLFEGCPKNICIPIIPKICDKSFINCTDILKNDSRVNVQCNLSVRDKINTCANLVKKLQYKFYHNGTKGVTDVSLLAILENVSYEFGTDVPEIDQEFFVNFLWRNATTKKSSSLSGNPGYLIGKPIVIGTLLTIMNGTETLFKIKRNASEYSQNFLTIPKNINGNCVLTPSEYLSIEFGYNVLTRCKFNFAVYGSKKKVNGTEICRTLENSLMRLWNIDNGKMVGLFGNAYIKNLNDWQGILYNKPPLVVLNDTLGVYYFKNNSVLCKNIARRLQIDIFHARVDVGSLVNQEKILAVTFSFDDYANLSLALKKPDNSFLLNMDLETRVSFYDLTEKKEKKVVDPPSLEIKLPYDFFYPFVRINNGGYRFAQTFVNLVILLIVSVYLK